VTTPAEPLPFDVGKAGEIRTYSGHYLDVFNPDPTLLDIRDIARGLSMRPRYGAQLPEWYSVAEHSCHVHDVLRRQSPRATREGLLVGLLHDAPEAYIGDMPKPVKMKLGDYQALEGILCTAIFDAYGLSMNLLDPVAPVDRIDKAIRHAERLRLWGRPIPEEAPPWVRDVRIWCWPWERAEAEFLSRYAALTGESTRRGRR
jgi:hypothetical protein